MPICTLLVSTLLLFAAFLPPLGNGVTEGKGGVAGGGLRGNGVKVTGGWLWTAYLGIPPVSGKLPGFQSLVEILAAG